jgi:uncharacterized membrane protein YciS (DUF1049 family)
MPLIPVVLTLVVIAVILGAMNTFVPVGNNIKTILNGAVGLCVLVWLLYLFGFIHNDGGLRLPRVE